MEETKQMHRYGKNFELPVILEVLSKVEQGLSRNRLCQEYGMSRGALNDWLKRYGSERYLAGKKVMFSDEQRRSIVRAILQGRMTIRDARQQYNIKTDDTIRAWLRTFGEENKETLIPSPTAMKDKKKPATTESEEIKALKKALAASQLKVAALETMVDIAERELKIDIRKKSGAKQSPK
jgi:transposase